MNGGTARPLQTGLIQLRGIVKTFKTLAGDVTVLKNINIDFHPGQFVGIVGKSGSGKSTLVNMITGIDHPTSGVVQINGTRLHDLGEGQLAVWRGRNMGVVFQFFQLLPMLTVLENTLLPMDLANLIPPEQREPRAFDLLEMVGVEDFADKLPAALSGGQQQSAAIARSLANDPPILVTDEPTGNLDSLTAESVFAIFEKLARQGKTIIMVTHDNSLADRTGRKIILSDGEIIGEPVAAALPFLTHPQMLQLTHLVKRRTLSPGESLPPGTLASAGLLIAAGGSLYLESIHLTRQNTAQVIFSPGKFLSAAACPAEEWAGLSLRANPEEPVDLLVVEKDAFDTWLLANPTALLPLQEKGSLKRGGEARPSTHRRARRTP